MHKLQSSMVAVIRTDRSGDGGEWQPRHTRRRSDMAAIQTDSLREQLLALIDGRDARMSFDEAVAAFPSTAINAFPPNVAYTPWHLLEHLRLTQWDILDYIENRAYREPSWPSDYWPA